MSRAAISAVSGGGMQPPALSPRNRGSSRAYDVPVLAPTMPGKRGLDALAWGLVGLGIVLRLGRYLLNFPFWGDELMLVQNYLDRDYADLLKPLTLERRPWVFWPSSSPRSSGWDSRSGRCGCSPCCPAWRACYCFATWRRACWAKCRWCWPSAFSPSAIIRCATAAECKPYGSDLAASLLLVWLAVCWWQNQTNRRWLWSLAVAAAALYFGGESGGVCRRRDQSGFGFTRLAIAQSAGVAGVCRVQRADGRHVFPVARLVTSTQYATTQKFMLEYWAGGFPPWQPLAACSWLASIHAGEMMAYPVGDDRFGSTLSLICFVAGAVAVARRKDRTLLVLVLAPLALARRGGGIAADPATAAPGCRNTTVPWPA